MNKEITICFRTSDWLLSALEAVAREEKRSLSQVIELISWKSTRNTPRLVSSGKREGASAEANHDSCFAKGQTSTRSSAARSSHP